MNSVVLVESQGSCALVRISTSKNLTGGTTWSSQSTSTDWLTRTHHWSSPRSKLAYKKPTSTRKLRKFPVTSGQGSKHRDWTASRWWVRWRSQSSSCQHHVITWRGQIPADHEYLDSVAWPCHDCEVAPVWHQCGTMTSQMLARASFSAVCLTVFPFEFRPRTFTIEFYGKKSFISELMILECSFPLSWLMVLKLRNVACWSCVVLSQIEVGAASVLIVKALCVRLLKVGAPGNIGNCVKLVRMAEGDFR